VREREEEHEKGIEKMKKGARCRKGAFGEGGEEGELEYGA